MESHAPHKRMEERAGLSLSVNRVVNECKGNSLRFAKDAKIYLTALTEFAMAQFLDGADKVHRKTGGKLTSLHFAEAVRKDESLRALVGNAVIAVKKKGRKMKRSVKPSAKPVIKKVKKEKKVALDE